MRTLRMKMVMIMVVLILALMTVIGAFLISGVSNFYISEFYVQMERTFSPEFIGQLQRLADEENGVTQMKELLMAQAGLGIDLSDRNVYILDSMGQVLEASDERTQITATQNLLAAMNGEVGQTGSVTSDSMDLAVPILTQEHSYIAYVLDNRATVDALTSELIGIILRALGLGLVICVVLSFLLARILIKPIQALTVGTRQVAAGDFSQRVAVEGHDEIGVLARNFNHMAKVLEDTISEAENERNKLSTLFLHMTDGVVAFSTSGAMIHCNPAAMQMLARGLDATTTFDELFGSEAELDTLLTLRRPQYLELQKTVGERELELFMAPFSSDQTQGGVLVVIHDVTAEDGRRVPVFYSLGNFLSHQDQTRNMLGGMADVTLEKNADDVRITHCELKPTVNVILYAQEGDWYSYRPMLLEDYTDELAGQHRFSECTVDAMWGLFDSITGGKTVLE